MMNNREMLKTTTEQERKLIREVLERAKQKQKKREGDSIKLPLYSYNGGCVCPPN